MKVAVLRFPGTNCEFDTQYAFEKLGHSTELVWHEENSLPAESDLVVVPGGFSYGDYLRSGSIARFSPVMKAVAAYANAGGKVLGICNGFQILTEAGLLPGALKRNTNLHFISKHQTLCVVSTDNAFLNQCKKGEVLTIPIAHADGNYYIDEAGLLELEANNQILLRYADAQGNSMSINGSVSAIAGICNKQKNVFGLMPHPERALEAILGSEDGVRMLKGFEA
ncbi:MAG TPA: phosphoribosylformylglycinamidine synthase subunit PurQ [Sulfurovum sp.]|jgi:phosphoribosylformylglycinamidine synthase|nr:MAG: phosphoribosylformylglycinamidine synthase I [Sulfurovum sp. 35-42-20]OYY55071.1 MAG: phosphoribosylformylglycinamidine synthase I [Sulfurovum sp. 28-43-6]OYZ24963.1 MAG: phosphoribosylformylglycinamidine synthase I [Sulfurovum sp. 16-42-52]OYZ48639.1 MAG: phosphoribosylformylglycinamidine synthase I [Sulfurovum sp. 24-42-9]OZA44950.1 MAG: phosphoribosylformylglycinamidine synthase I [Sulfurovum sp. 17-42-90]OZA59577.1 MAG: phosphoribosylformylglycinamidine synthase I [Sulfurovum sp. 3